MNTFLSKNYFLMFRHARLWESVVVLFLVIIELCWLAPWYHMLMNLITMPALFESVLVFSLVMLFSYFLAKWLSRYSVPLFVQQLGLGMGLAIGLFLSEKILLNLEDNFVLASLTELEPGAVLVFFTVLWLWWRGVSLERDFIHPNTVWRRFQFGLFMFMAFLAVSHRLQSDRPGIFLFVFFLFTGFLALIYARVSYVGISKGILKNPFSLKWLVFSGGILGLLVTVAAIIGSLLSGQYHQVLEFFLDVLQLIAAIFLFLVALPSLLVSVVISPLIAWLRQFISYQAVEQPPMDIEMGAYPIFQEVSAPHPVPIQIQSLLFWGIFLIALLFIFSRMRKIIRTKKETTDNGPESMLAKGELGEILRKALQNTLDAITARIRPVQRILAAAHIRRIYAALMDLFLQMEHPRPGSKTPGEFLPTMQALLPSVGDELQLITSAYVRVRYGNYPETEQEIEEVEIAWQNVLEAGERLKKSGRLGLGDLDLDEFTR